MRGRVLAVNAFVLGFLYPVGSLAQGRLADAVGLRWVTAGSGVLLGVSVGGVFVVRALRRRQVDPVGQVDPAGPVGPPDPPPGDPGEGSAAAIQTAPQ